MYCLASRVVNNTIAPKTFLLWLLLMTSWAVPSVLAESPKDLDQTTAPANLEAGDRNPSKDEVPERSRPAALKFKIVHAADDSPVADAKLDIHMYGRPLILNHEMKSDGDGLATFKYPDGPQPAHLWAMVRSPGLVPYYVNFGRDIIPAALPTEKTIRMEKGKKVGGTIIDPFGKPVAGAIVSIMVPATDTPSEIYFHLLYQTTREDGMWELDAAPLNIAGLSVGTEHPRLLGKAFQIQDTVEGRYQLEAGLTLTGRVVDEQGQPIPDAHVTIGQDRWGSVKEPVRVEKDGTYKVYALRPQLSWITAEAPQFAPQVKPVVIKDEMQPVDFELKPGYTVRFKVVDLDGTPIQGIRIIADKWNAFRSLWWSARSDAEGSATWNGAPSDGVEFDFVGEGYAAVRNVVLSPQDEPHVIAIPRPVKITGIVTDKDQQKIPEFRVVPGRKYSGGADIAWHKHDGTNGRNGKFEISYAEACDNIYVLIEAPGYRPWTSSLLAFQKGEHKLFVRLEPSSP